MPRPENLAPPLQPPPKKIEKEAVNKPKARPEKKVVARNKALSSNAKKIPPKPQPKIVKQKSFQPLPPPAKETVPSETFPISASNNQEEAETWQIGPPENSISEISVDQKIQYLHKLRNILQKNLSYPNAARRRNISGTIQLSFQISRAGKVFNVEVRNRANNILIKAARKLLHETRLPVPPENWPENSVIEIPLKYSLR
jgi:TonB family protein